MTSARIVGLASALVLLAFAVAVGAIPDSDDGEVHFCFNKKRPAKGAVRVINHEAGRRCRSGERELILDRLGPRGPDGPRGADGDGSAGPDGPGGADGAGGADGPTGATGASGWNRTFFDSVGPVALPSAGPQVSESVPGGTYLVSAVADIENDDTALGDTVSCSLDLTSAGPGDQQLAQSITYTIDQATLPLDAVKIALDSTATVSLVFEPETISLTCTPGAGDTATLRRASLTLIRFASID